jgi:hypothetical protein
LIFVSATPILDLHQAPPEPPKAWRSTLIRLLLGVPLGILLFLVDDYVLPGTDLPAFNGLLLIPGMYVAIALHEIGHLVAGKLVGIDNGGISVGPFVFIRSGGNWIFRFERTLWGGGFFKPLTSPVHFRPSHYAWLVAGGPFATPVSTILLWLICVQFGSGRWNWIRSLFWISIILVGASIIPISSALNKSDSARLWQLIRHPDQARSWMALLTLQTEEAKALLKNNISS